MSRWVLSPFLFLCGVSVGCTTLPPLSFEWNGQQGGQGNHFEPVGVRPRTFPGPCNEAGLTVSIWSWWHLATWGKTRRWKPARRERHQGLDQLQQLCCGLRFMSQGSCFPVVQAGVAGSTTGCPGEWLLSVPGQGRGGHWREQTPLSLPTCVDFIASRTSEA